MQVLLNLLFSMPRKLVSELSYIFHMFNNLKKILGPLFQNEVNTSRVSI